MGKRKFEPVIAVEIVRPKMTPGRAVGQLSLPFIRAWLVMLVLGSPLPDAGIGYWQSLLGLVLVDLVLASSSYTNWTRQRQEVA